MNDDTKNTAVCFPLAGAQRVAATHAYAYDKRWQVMDVSSGQLLADDSGLAEISVELKFGYLVLRAPGMLRLDIPLDVIEDDPSVLETVMVDGKALRMADEGAWAEEWVSQVLGRPARLLKHCSQA